MNLPDQPGRRVVLVLSSLGAGGAEGVIAQIANYWVLAGHKVTVVAFDDPADPIFHRFEPGVAFVRLGLPPGGGRLPAARRSVRRVRAMRTVLRRLRPDLVVSFLLKINVLVLGASLGLGLKVVVSERNHPTRGAGSRVWQWGRTWLYPRAAAVVLQTEASRAALPRRIAQRGIVIPNPVGQGQCQFVPGGPVMLVAVGRLEPQKGFDLLLEAFRIVARRHPDWQLTIWGEGPQRGELEARRAALGLDGQVRMPGVSGRPGEWRNAASAFVLSSRFEGFSNALAEALAAGLPVVAFDCEYGVRELLDGGRCGLLVPKGDISALAESIERLLCNTTLQQQLSTEAFQSMKQFSPHMVLEQWDRLLV